MEHTIFGPCPIYIHGFASSSVNTSTSLHHYGLVRRPHNHIHQHNMQPICTRKLHKTQYHLPKLTHSHLSRYVNYVVFIKCTPSCRKYRHPGAAHQQLHLPSILKLRLRRHHWKGCRWSAGEPVSFLRQINVRIMPKSSRWESSRWYLFQVIVQYLNHWAMPAPVRIHSVSKNITV